MLIFVCCGVIIYITIKHMEKSMKIWFFDGIGYNIHHNKTHGEKYENLVF